MERTLDAIYENGVLTPLEPLDLPERQRLKITIQTVAPENPEDALAAWQAVYADLSQEEVSEIEDIVVSRANFFNV